MAQRPRRRRPPRPIVDTPVLAGIAVLTARTFGGVGTGTVEITIGQDDGSVTPWDDPAGLLLTYLTSQGVSVKTTKAGVDRSIDMGDFTATGEATIEGTGDSFSPPDAAVWFDHPITGNAPMWCPTLGCWLVTNPKLGATLYE